MPQLPLDDLQISQPTEPATPIWAPTSGVPMLARILAYTFGGFMLLAFFVSCLSHPAPDIPNVPTTWNTLVLKQGSSVPYPREWHPYHVQDATGETLLSFDAISLLPSAEYSNGIELYPTHIEIIMLQLPANSEIARKSTVNRYISQVLDRRLENFNLQGGEAMLDSDENVPFIFGERRNPMSGEWTVLLHDGLALVLVGCANPEGWQATQLILHEMASRVAWK